MKKHIGLICIILAVFVMSQTAVPGIVFCDDIEKTESEEIIFDVSALEDENTVEEYARQFDGADVKIVIQGNEIDCIPKLRRFDFHTLDLQIEFNNDKDLKAMKTIKELLFPENLKSVTVLCAGEPILTSGDAIENFIISLWVCCPEALLNGSPVSEWAEYVAQNSTSGLVSVYESHARMNLLFEQAMNGELEVIQSDPEYYLKLIIMIYGDSDISSLECIKAGEPFYNVPGSCLANSYAEANTAIFIYPVTSLMGTYANGGDAICTYTKVLVVDLNSMKMYETYTAVRNDPPESIEIQSENGVYSSQGATGDYEPQTALDQILSSDRIKEYKEETETALQKETDGSGQTDPQVAAEEETTSSKSEKDSLQTEELLAVSSEAVEARKTEDDTETEDSAERKPAQDAAKLSNWLTAEVLEHIFELLDDDSYKETYEGLKKTKDLVKGSKGEQVLAVQKTLTALGQNIAEDSSLGNATLTAVNNVLVSYNSDKVSKVNSSAYSALMPALLLSVDEEKAKDLLAEIFNDPEDAFEYLKGCLMYSRGNFYQAKEGFENSGISDSEKRARDCVQDMPNTGLLYRNNDVPGNDSSLAVQINEADDAAVTCIMIYTEDNILAASMIIRGSGSVSAALPAGSYRVIKATGYRWYGIYDMFGEEGEYEQIIFDDGLEYLKLVKGYDYSIRFNPGEHSNTSMGLGSEVISFESAASAQ